MLAYHNKPELKAAFLAEISKHEAADRIIHGEYATFKKNGTAVFIGGCAVGCSLESLRAIEGLPAIEHSDHRLYERYLGVPVMLARLEDRIFEGLPLAESLTWPRRFSEAIRVGADLSMVGPRFLHDLLIDPDGAVRRRAAKNATVKAAVDAVAALFVRWFEAAVKPPTKEWQAVRRSAYAAADAAAYAASAAAAYAAADASAASAAAYASAASAAADAAASADASAASASAAADASAASAAAYAAYAAASAARHTEFSRQAAALIRLLEAA